MAEDEDFKRVMEGLDHARAIVEGTADPASYRVHVPRPDGSLEVIPGAAVIPLDPADESDL